MYKNYNVVGAFSYYTDDRNTECKKLKDFDFVKDEIETKYKVYKNREGGNDVRKKV